MSDTKIKDQARKIAKSCNVKVVYRNSREEWFTSENAAANSDKAANIETFDFSNEAAEPEKKKLLKITTAVLKKNPELADNGWKEGDEVEELDWALKNKKPAEPPVQQ